MKSSTINHTQYWKGVFFDAALLKKYKKLNLEMITSQCIETIHDILSCAATGAYMEQFFGRKELLKARLDQSGRLILTPVFVEGHWYLHVIDVVLNHKYNKSHVVTDHSSRVIQSKLYSEEKYKEIINGDSQDAALLYRPASTHAPARASYEGETRRSTVLLEEVHYFDGIYISLSEEQKQALNLIPPIFISGEPGSGKSFVALAMLTSFARTKSHDDEPSIKKKACYVTRSKALADKMQKIWHETPHDNEHEVIFLAYDSLVDTNETYDLVIVDEAQDFNPDELDRLKKLSKQGNYFIDGKSELRHQACFLLDPHQSLISSDLAIIKHLKQQEMTHIHLPTSYRCALPVKEMANALLNLKHKLAKGKLNKEEHTALIITEEDKAKDKGAVYWYDQESKIKEIIDQHKASTHFAVVVDNEEIKTAFKIKYPDVALIFTVDEIKGLEYDTILAYKILNDPVFNKASKIIEKEGLDASQPQKVNLPKEGQEQSEYRVPFNRAFTAFTRSKINLYVFQPVDKRKAALATTLKAYAKQTAPRQKTNHSSTSRKEVWIKEIEKLISVNQIEPARAAWILHISKDHESFNQFSRQVLSEGQPGVVSSASPAPSLAGKEEAESEAALALTPVFKNKGKREGRKNKGNRKNQHRALEKPAPDQRAVEKEARSQSDNQAFVKQLLESKHFNFGNLKKIFNDSRVLEYLCGVRIDGQTLLGHICQNQERIAFGQHQDLMTRHEILIEFLSKGAEYNHPIYKLFPLICRPEFHSDELCTQLSHQSIHQYAADGTPEITSLATLMLNKTVQEAKGLFSNRKCCVFIHKLIIKRPDLAFTFNWDTFVNYPGGQILDDKKTPPNAFTCLWQTDVGQALMLALLRINPFLLTSIENDQISHKKGLHLALEVMSSHPKHQRYCVMIEKLIRNYSLQTHYIKTNSTRIELFFYYIYNGKFDELLSFLTKEYEPGKINRVIKPAIWFVEDHSGLSAIEVISWSSHQALQDICYTYIERYFNEENILIDERGQILLSIAINFHQPSEKYLSAAIDFKRIQLTTQTTLQPLLTPLRVAVDAENIEAIAWLHEHKYARLPNMNIFEGFPFRAAVLKSVALVDALLKYYPTLNQIDCFGLTPYTLALELNHKLIADRLREYNHNPAPTQSFRSNMRQMGQAYVYSQRTDMIPYLKTTINSEKVKYIYDKLSASPKNEKIIHGLFEECFGGVNGFTFLFSYINQATSEQGVENTVTLFEYIYSSYKDFFLTYLLKNNRIQELALLIAEKCASDTDIPYLYELVKLEGRISAQLEILSLCLETKLQYHGKIQSFYNLVNIKLLCQEIIEMSFDGTLMRLSPVFKLSNYPNGRKCLFKLLGNNERTFSKTEQEQIVRALCKIPHVQEPESEQMTSQCIPLYLLAHHMASGDGVIGLCQFLEKYKPTINLELLCTIKQSNAASIIYLLAANDMVQTVTPGQKKQKVSTQFKNKYVPIRREILFHLLSAHKEVSEFEIQLINKELSYMDDATKLPLRQLLQKDKTGKKIIAWLKKQEEKTLKRQTTGSASTNGMFSATQQESTHTDELAANTKPKK